ncbi:hypothetical protein GCM10010269_34740 [Streptomyces humidus]|uniref:Uncharacterized protein n=1 Tax=Streptomyces humidus TaxID=52259 RepID=A0A918FWG4_9ACTN|nr:hypothetical protein [Streptomyces humidus]GGR92757.1 hypothetical protein GCM10010269_34740 [Streptomyces humidus]
MCIALSIVAHSSTDVPIARMFDVEDLVGIPEEEDGQESIDVGQERKTVV